MANGKGAVVLTGASGGMGRAIAHGLARRSVPTVLIGRTGSALEDVRRALPDPTLALAMVADVRDASAIAAVMDVTQSTFGSVGALICCAVAEGPEGQIDDVSLADVAETLAVNLTGALVCCRSAVQHMRQNRRGNIVLFSSGAGHSIRRPEVRSLAYQISKFGVEGMVDGLAAQLRETGININGVRPGRTASGPNLGSSRPGLRAPEQVVESVLFLAGLAPGEMSGCLLEAEAFERGYRPPSGDHTMLMTSSVSEFAANQSGQP